jgi:site-specific DNA-cytosine methylase
MNVLSLFDGMSCGQIALNKLGIKYKNYFASEIDKYAIKVTQDNFPNTIHLGDVKKIDFKSLPKIDLLMGGSPCQGFSLAGKHLNFNDPRSALFFEYVRALRELKPKYFLLENVRMKKESEDVISEHLGVKPIMINSSLISAQNRVRLYWTNLPVTRPEDKKIYLKDVLEYCPEKINILVHNIYGGFNENECRVFEDKSPTIRANSGGGSLPSVFNGTGDDARSMALDELRSKIRKLTVLECKRLQTVPDDYKMNVSNTQAYKMLGNGWTVDVIAHILKGIKNL